MQRVCVWGGGSAQDDAVNLTALAGATGMRGLELGDSAAQAGSLITSHTIHWDDLKPNSGFWEAEL